MSRLFDSCILIDHLCGVPQATALLRSVEHGAISEITWIEVLVGARTKHDEVALRGFLSGFERLPVDRRVSEEAVLVRRERRLKLPDALILATARVHGHVLVTRNTRDFDGGAADIEVPYELDSPA